MEINAGEGVFFPTWSWVFLGGQRTKGPPPAGRRCGSADHWSPAISQPLPGRVCGMGAPFTSDHVAGGEGRGVETKNPWGRSSTCEGTFSRAVPLLSHGLWAAFYSVVPHVMSLLPTSTLPGAPLANRKGQYLLWGSLPWGIEGASRLHLQVGYGGRRLGSGPRWTAWG